MLHGNKNHAIGQLPEGRSADTDWCLLMGAQTGKRQNPVGVEQTGGLGVDGAGRNGPGPPNAATLCNYA